VQRPKFDFLTPRIINKETTTKKSLLLQKSIDSLAQQFCLIDQKQFCEIPLDELRGQKWSKSEPFKNAPKITRCIEFFNRISFWSATEILTQKNLKNRIKILKRLICLAQRLIIYQNYNTAFAFISSFSYASISRLKKTWKVWDFLLF